MKLHKTLPTESLESPPPQRAWWRGWLIGLVAVLVLVLVVYLAYVRPAKAVAAAYQKRLSSNTFNYSGSLEFYGQDFLSALDSKLSFDGQYQRQPLAARLGFGGIWTIRPMSGEALIDDGRLYVKLKGSQLPTLRYKQSSFVVPLRSQWYSAKLDQSLFDNLCQNTAPSSAASQLALYRQVKTLHWQNSWWVNFWDSQGTHFHGSLPGSQLAALLQAVRKAMPAGCDLNTIGFGVADAHNIQTVYDLWTNPAGDRLQLGLEDKVLGSRLLLTVTTSGYGQSVSVKPPTSSIDLNAIYAKVTPNYFQSAP